MIDLFLFRQKKLYVCNLDVKKGFDNVNRLKLWQKLISCDITGKILTIIKNMYNKAKSCDSTNGTKSTNFPCQIGVRQGENLSPLLFSIYLSDLESFLSSKYNGFMGSEFIDDNAIATYLKLHILLYADDTVLLAVSSDDLQKSINVMLTYCDD